MNSKKNNSHTSNFWKKQKNIDQQKENVREEHDGFQSVELNDGLQTYHETLSQNECYKQYVNSREQSMCPSIEDYIINGYLQDLKQEIKLKSEALHQAESFIIILEEEITTTKESVKDLLKKLVATEQKNEELEAQIEFLKNRKIDGSLNKTIPRTRTYLTEKQISSQFPTDPLKLISFEIFNQYADNFEALLNSLSEFVIKQKDYEIDNSVLTKLETHNNEVSDLLYGKYDQSKCSKSTLQTLIPQTDLKKDSLSLHNYYEQAIGMYKQHCNKLSIMVCESMNCIQQLAKGFSSLGNIYTQMPQPQILIPNALMKIVINDCKNITNRMFSKLKIENAEVFHIANKMSQWISKNVKDKPFLSNESPKRN